MSDEVGFLQADTDENYLHTHTMIGMVKHSQSSQNSKFAMSLEYLEKENRDEVDFMHADKHQNFLKIDLKTLSIINNGDD